MKAPFFALSVLSLSASALADIQNDQIKEAFSRTSLTLTDSNLSAIRDDVVVALQDHCGVKRQGAVGSSKTRYAAVQIAAKLGVNPQLDQTVSKRIVSAIESLPCEAPACGNRERPSCPPPPSSPQWETEYDKTLNLTSDPRTLGLFQAKGYSPVKISWEDIGRYQNSVWGDRISDVGIWVRKDESDPHSAQLALSVRKDANFRDKVLMVPTEKIKIHLHEGRDTREVSLRERLKELNLTSKTRDETAIVSNQFAIVPVPGKRITKDAASGTGRPPRAAFTFSIYPYGSTNFVITDVIEGSSDAIVGPGSHQLLFANVDGKRAPFTASRSEDRQDLLQMEAALKSRGMDVDVQRYYLIQIPLKKEAKNIVLSNMGTPPLRYGMFGGDVTGTIFKSGTAFESAMPAPMVQSYKKDEESGRDLRVKRSDAPGLTKVAIGRGEAEGEYLRGAGFEGQRSEEPVRVTVVYFVTPTGEVTEEDTKRFADTFASWDKEALWGGSFVTGE